MENTIFIKHFAIVSLTLRKTIKILYCYFNGSLVCSLTSSIWEKLIWQTGEIDIFMLLFANVFFAFQWQTLIESWNENGDNFIISYSFFYGQKILGAKNREYIPQKKKYYFVHLTDTFFAKKYTNLFVSSDLVWWVYCLCCHP